MSDHYYERYLDLRHQTQDEDGLDRTTALAIRDAVDYFCESAEDGFLGYEALEALEASEEHLRAVWPT